MITRGAFQIVAAQVVCGDTNHGPASVGVSTDRNRSDKLKCAQAMLIHSFHLPYLYRKI